MLRKILFFAVALLVPVANANAGTVTLFMTPNSGAGTWQLHASSSLGDNSGIASFNVPLQNVLTSNNVSPFAQVVTVPDNFNTAGFSELRTSLPAVGASQKLVPTPTPNLIYGYGQEDSSFGEKGITGIAGASSQIDWDAVLLLAEGTYDPLTQTPAVNFQAPGLSILTFNNNSSAQVSAAAIVDGGAIPEPSTMALLGLAMVGAIGFLRRR